MYFGVRKEYFGLEKFNKLGREEDLSSIVDEKRKKARLRGRREALASLTLALCLNLAVTRVTPGLGLQAPGSVQPLQCFYLCTGLIANSNMSGPWATTDEDVDKLPYEVKRLVFDHVDLQTLKHLRLVSRSWATAGTELLLLPTLFVRSYSIDIPRLNRIGQSPAVSRHAATTVKTLVFQSVDWDPVILRRVLTSRHEARVIWETADYVPTIEEQEALEELDAMIAQRSEDQLLRRYSADFLVRVLKLLPRVNTIKIVCQNLFKNRILRKVFAEFHLETYRRSGHQTLDVLSAAKQAGLTIQHFAHEQILSTIFEGHDYQVMKDMSSSMQNLESLHLMISDIPEKFPSRSAPNLTLRDLLRSLPRLQNLFIKFESLNPVDLKFLEEVTLPDLHTVSLTQLIMQADIFFPFLERHAGTLKRMRISSAEIAEGHGSWSSFLRRIKESVGSELEKFQLSYLLRSHDGDETYYFRPIYNEDWTDASDVKVFPTGDRWRKDIEDYVVRDGHWPILEADNVSHIFD